MLRQANIRIKQIKTYSSQQLQKTTQIPLLRCEELVALATFQQMSSIGPATASDLWLLGIKSMTNLKTANPMTLYQRICQITHTQQDPCVYDVFACAIAQANYPDLPDEQKQWWYYSDKRPDLRLK